MSFTPSKKLTISSAFIYFFCVLNQSLDDTKKSVSDGKSTVASAITAQGVSTAADAEFTAMATNIGTVATNKYNAGYSSGRTQGRSDVTGSPNSYSLYTKSQYDSNYNSGYNSGYSAGGGGIKYKSGTINTGLNGETTRSITFSTGLSSITKIQVRAYHNASERDNRVYSVSISGGNVTVSFYAPNYITNYIDWLAVGK